jgi:hypothetical protein
MASTKFGDLLKQAKESGAMGDTVIPDGDFLLEVVKTNCKDPAEGPIGLLVKVVGDEEGQPLPEGDEANGVVSWINLYFSEKAAPISFRQLKAFGFEEDFLANSESAQVIADAATGIRFTASVGHRNWGDNGSRTSNEFKGVTVVVPPSVGGVEADPQTEAEGPEDEAY